MYRRKIPVSSILKAEIKHIFAELTVSLGKSLGKFTVPHYSKPQIQKTFDTDLIQAKMQSIINEFENFRRNVNLEKQKILVSISNLDDKNVQSDIQKFIEITDNFDTMMAKQQGVSSKLLACLKRIQNEPLGKNSALNTSNKGEIEIEIAPFNEDSPKKENIEKLQEKTTDSKILSLQLQLTLEKEKNSKLQKTILDNHENIRLKDEEIKSLHEHLSEYIKIAEEQYAQIENLQQETANYSIKTITKVIKEFFKAMDKLSICVTENQESEIEIAREEFEHMKAVLLQLIMSIEKNGTAPNPINS